MKRLKFLSDWIDYNTPMTYCRGVVFVETSLFTKQIMQLLSDESYLSLQRELVDNPKRGELIVGGGGIRKIRWSLDNDKGKSGGIRTIYYYKESDEKILMLFAYPKNVADNLTDKQIAVLRELAKEFHDEQ